MTGQTVAHYRILAKIGEGGMGAVWRAEDTRLGRTVALKLLTVDDPQLLARFLQEARLASSLNHPNIATIHDVGEAGGRHYIAMELVEGESLRRRGTPSPPVLLDLAIQIADALTEAHSSGIVHRDIKGDNILVTPQGRIKMLDFGLAKRLAEPGGTGLTQSIARTETGAIMGTVSYMAPEQALGQPVDARSDLFSFGVALYEAAAGRLPFAGPTTTAVFDNILHQPPEPPGSVLDPILLKLLEKDPNDRYQSAKEVLVDLRRLKRAWDTGKLAAPRRPVAASPRRHWRWAAALVLTFAAGAVVGRYLLNRPVARPAMRFTAVTNFAGVESHPTFSPDGGSVAFVSDRGGQFDLWVSLVSAGSLVRITNDPNLKTRPRWSPDGARIAYGRLNDSGVWDIWVVPALGGTPRRILPEASDPAWSPEGRRLAYANRATNGIWMADATGANARAVTQPEAGLLHAQPAFSRDGRQIAFVRRMTGPYGELVLADAATGRLRQLTGDEALALSPVWAPDDRWIYFASSRGGTFNLWRISPRGGEPEQVTTGQGDDAELDLSADGRRLVFSTYRSNINLAEVALDPAPPSPVKWLTQDSARGELGPAYSPDGRRIAYFTNRKGAEREGTWVMGADGSNPALVVEDDRINVLPRWSGADDLIYSSIRRVLDPSDRDLRRVSVSGGKPQIYRLSVDASWGDVAADGRLVARTPNGGLQVFDPRTGQTQKLDRVSSPSPKWSPDGRRFSYLRAPGRADDPQAGLWLYEFPGEPRLLFRGWVVWHSWTGQEELLVLEGKPDLNGVLWRVRPDGSRTRLAATLRLLHTYWIALPYARFDASPDGRRMVTEALEVHDADIGMMENIP